MVPRVKIKAKYHGRCQTCGLTIEPGEYVMWLTSTKKLIHYGCELIQRTEPRLPEPTKPEKRVYGMPDLHRHERSA